MMPIKNFPRHLGLYFRNLVAILPHMTPARIDRLLTLTESPVVEHPRECTVCGFSGLFRSTGTPPRPDVLCPGCGSLERHRLLFLALRESVQLSPDTRLLHFAPEPALRERLRIQFKRYFCADLHMPGVDIHLDIEQIDLPDQSVDAILCSHVLEHVDDRRALAEMFRVLRPGGTLLLLIPVIENWSTTYENEAICSPDDRFLHFGQHDHVRYYGADCRDRMRAAGFHLREFTADPQQCVQHSLIRGETLFICQRLPD